MQMAKVSAALARLDRAQAAVHLGAHRPDDRRRHRQLRDARRPEHRRAEGAHRLRRPARHRADDPAEAAGGIPAQRVPGRARHARPGRGSPRHEGHHRARAPVHARRARAGRCSRARVRWPWPPPRSSRHADLLDRLFALETFGIKLGLENIARSVRARSVIPSASFASLHVAGTNGKGSVAAMVARRARRRRLARRPLHVAAPDRHHRALRHRRPAGRARRARSGCDARPRLRRPAPGDAASCACRPRSSRRRPPPPSRCSARRAWRWP